MKLTPGDVVEVKWPNGSGFHTVLDSSSEEHPTVLLQLVSDKGWRNVTIDKKMVSRVVMSYRDRW